MVGMASSPAGSENRLQTVQVLTELITFRITSEQTGGAYTLCEAVSAPGGGVPPHRQHKDTEAFYVLDGTYTFMLNDEVIEAGPGEQVFIPIGAVHSFQNRGEQPARMLILNSPGGIHEAFFKEVGVPVEDQSNPPAPDMEAQVAKVMECSMNYGIEMLPPQPE
jgi:quercetin dioxygenase-like cupin family protein